MNKFRSALVAATLAIGVSAAAQAVVIFPDSVVASSSFATYDSFYAIDAGPNAANTDWASNSEGTASYLDINLGAIYRLTSISATDRVTSGGANLGFVGGLSDFTTQYSLTAYTDATFTTAAGPAILFSKSAPISPATPADFLDTQIIAGLTAQFVRYRVVAANGENPGLSNLSFVGTAVPEPQAWALLVVGFGMVGVVARRRKTVFAA